jgi:hypothetical protein
LGRKREKEERKVGCRVKKKGEVGRSENKERRAREGVWFYFLFLF